jgi:hypothetical protein
MKKYLRTCPVCRSDHIGPTEIPERYENTVVLEMECQECGTLWYNIFTFDHAENEMGDELYDSFRTD